MIRLHLASLVLACACALAPTAAATEEPPPPTTEARLLTLLETARRLEAQLTEARAQDPAGATSDRLRALEGELARLQEEVRRLADDAKAAADAADALSRADQRRIQLTVYGNLDASAYEGENSIFDGRIFEMVLTGQPHERFSFVAQVEFEHAAEVGGVRGGEVVVEQAYATFTMWPSLGVRAGIFLVPFGNLLDHFPSNRAVVTRPIVAYVVTPSDWTDNGVGLVGRRLLGSWLLGYEAWAMAGLGADITGYGLRSARQGYGVDNNDDKALAGRVSLKKENALTFGLSGYRGRHDDAGRRTLLGWGADFTAQRGAVSVAGEYDAFRADRGPEPHARFRGYYLRGTYSFGGGLLRDTVFGRGLDAPRLSLVAEANEVTLDGSVEERMEHTRERRFTVGMDYRPAVQWVLKLSYEWNDTTNLPIVKGDHDGWVGSVAFVF